MYSKKQRAVFKVIALIIACAMILSSFVYVFADEQAELNSRVLIGSNETGNAMTSDEAGEALEFLRLIMEYIEEDYVDNITFEQLVNGAYDGVFNTLDPYSVYYPANEDYDSFIETVQGEFTGIGITMESYDGQTRIVSVLPGTPAAKSGLKAGDIITAVDDVKDVPYTQMPSKLKGKEGTQVKVTVLRDGKETLHFTMTRAIVKIASVIYEMKTATVGYIRIADFDGDSDKEFAAAVQALKGQGMKSLVLDLRDNGGGLINTALEIAGQLIPEGKTLMHFMKKGKTTDTRTSSGKGLGMPYVVLVNQNTASASEILAGAIKDNQTAKLVGTQTFGKGVAQTSINLKNGGGLKLTISSFVTPNKTTIQGIGITPDVVATQENPKVAEDAKAQAAGFAPMSEEKNYQPGEKGLNVYAAQQRLLYIGYSDVKLTGLMDTDTVSALKKFQATKWMKADGVLTTSLCSALEQAVNSKVEEIGKRVEQDQQLEKALELLSGSKGGAM